MSDMLGQIFGNQDDKPVELVEVRYLPAERSHNTVNHSDKPQVPQDADSPPEGGSTASGVLPSLVGKGPKAQVVRSIITPWLPCDGGCFYVNLAVVGPVPEEGRNCFPLPRGQANYLLQATLDLLQLFKEHPW